MPCSVCGQTCVKSSTGGVLLWERNGFISAICENCWNQYSTKKPEERCCQNEFQLAALMVLSRLVPGTTNVYLGQCWCRNTIVSQRHESS